MSASGIVLAAGRGERFGQDKALVSLQGVPVLLYSVQAFLEAGVAKELVVVVRPGMELQMAAVLKGIDFPVRVVVGGQRRRDSSLAGVEAAQGEFVLIHDVARPLVTPGLIRRVFSAAQTHGAAVPVVPVVDTLRYAEGGFLQPGALPRPGLVAMQTPQGFRRDLLLPALRQCSEDLPDDAAALLLQGVPVAVVPGDPRNLKLTYPEDLLLASALLQADLG
ncbi:MAG: 2-C-methyl-D-erythritol 4-phosphate cytidylyltransferase [Candidatus Bipolaricaulaceae bacterium]